MKPTALLLVAIATAGLNALHAAEQKTLPTVVVNAPSSTAGTITEATSESDLVGPYQQPEWTMHRRFTTTRVYLQRAPWEVGVEQWWRMRTYDDAKTRHLFIEEIEIGLPYRFQLDLYLDWAHEKGETNYKDVAVELRWALANWGEIPLNPTLYAEYKFTDPRFGGDVLETKILLGDEITKGVSWGVNLIWERELSGEKANEFAATQGVSRTLIDQVLSVGVEMQFKYENVSGSRSDAEHKFQIGPSMQWRPTKRTHLDLVGLFGCTRESPEVETFVVFGFDFGGGKEDGHYHPTSGFRG